jgi:hypothetical protein
MKRTTFSLRTYYASRKHPEWPGTDSIYFLTADTFGRETRRKEIIWEDPDVYERIILKKNLQEVG